MVGDAIDDERVDITLQMWQQMDQGSITDKFEELGRVIQGIVLEHVDQVAASRQSYTPEHTADPSVVAKRVFNSSRLSLARVVDCRVHLISAMAS